MAMEWRSCCTAACTRIEEEKKAWAVPRFVVGKHNKTS